MSKNSEIKIKKSDKNKKNSKLLSFFKCCSSNDDKSKIKRSSNANNINEELYETENLIKNIRNSMKENGVPEENNRINSYINEYQMVDFSNVYEENNGLNETVDKKEMWEMYEKYRIRSKNK